MHDVAIIGGGPGGATAGGVLARAGLKAVILERDRFPRFHIGESLLPLARHVYDRLGLSEKLDRAGFQRKYGAQFVSSDGAVERAFDFSGGTDDPHRIAFEVDRARFDHLLLDHAREGGCEVREETSVLEVSTSETEPCRLKVRSGGRDETVEARWVIDASGQGSLLSKMHDLRVNHPEHRKIAVFTRYKGASRRPGRQAGNIDIVFADRCWFWLIPLADDEMSVGAVGNVEEWKAAGCEPEEFYRRKIAQAPYIVSRLGAAPRCDDVRALANFSYGSKRFAGPGFVLVGDAAAFLDPIFSTGVMLAMQTGELAAKVLIERRPWRTDMFGAYERQFRKWMRIYFRMIEAYYSPGFVDIFFNPRDGMGLVSTVMRLLTGDSDMGFGGRLKLNIFYFFIWLNRKLGFAKDPRSKEATTPHG